MCESWKLFNSCYSDNWILLQKYTPTFFISIFQYCDRQSLITGCGRWTGLKYQHMKCEWNLAELEVWTREPPADYSRINIPSRSLLHICVLLDISYKCLVRYFNPVQRPHPVIRLSQSQCWNKFNNLGPFFCFRYGIVSPTRSRMLTKKGQRLKIARG